MTRINTNQGYAWYRGKRIIATGRFEADRIVMCFGGMPLMTAYDTVEAESMVKRYEIGQL